MGKEYNLNTVKEFNVTDDFLSINFEKRGRCQNYESKSDCKTRTYKDAVLNQCKCLPFNIRVSDVVMKRFTSKLFYEYFTLGSTLFSCPNVLCQQFDCGLFPLFREM